MTDAVTLVWSDGWLMYSILAAAGDGDATLADVIGMGDAINHAIFTADEINGGLDRLDRAGFVTVSGAGMRPSQIAIDLYARARHDAKYARGVLNALRESMGVPDWAPNSPSPGASLSSERFDLGTIIQAARQENHQRFQEELAKLRQRNP